MYLSSRAVRPLTLLIALGLAWFARPAAAQESGKVQGRITDAASGQPLAGAQVSIAGTRLGNISNAEGFYFINNVPAGVHDISAQFIGYQAVTVREQRVLAGQTITVDFKLAQSAVQIAALEIIGETQPLVPRDQVASKNIVTGQTVNDLPVDDATQIITLQPGVVAGVGKGLSIRGGRSGEEAVYIDGVLVRNFNAGLSNLEVGVNSLSEVDVLTGGFSAQYGEAQSGIINYVTRSGGRRWNGALSLQTDEIMPKELSHGVNRVELSFGGPLFGNLGLFVAGTAEGRRYSNAGKGWRDVPIYVASGVDTVVSYTPAGTNDTRDVIIPRFVEFNQGGSLPFSNSDEATLDAKLDYTYGSGSRLFLTGKFSRNQGRNAFGGGLGDLYNPSGYSGGRRSSQAFIVGWTHNFVQSAEQALALDVKLAMTRDEGTSGILDREWDLDNRNPFLGFTMSSMKFVVEEDDFPVDKDLVDRFLRNDGRRTPFDITRTDLQRAQEFRLNPYGTISGFATRGLGGTFGFNREEQLQARVTVDWQVNRQNRLKFGGDWFDIDTRVASVGYQSLSFAQFWVEKPKRQSLFVQDRLDLGDLVIEGGLRYDRFDPNTNFATTPGYFNLDEPESFEKAPVRSTLSPRLGVSFPVTVNSTFRLSYGHFSQLPDLNEYYFGKNTDFFRFRNTNTNDRFARPADIGKTIAFEFGYRQLIGPDFVLDVSAYNRDKTKDATYRKLAWDDPTNPGAIAYLNTLTNGDFGTIRGVDLRLDRRFGRLLNVMLGYSYQDARNTGTDPLTFTRLFARIEGNANQLLGLPPNPAQAIRQTEENRDHNLTGNFSLNFPANYDTPFLRNFGLFGTFRFISGLPYSPVTDVGQAIVTGPPTDIFAGELRDDEISTARMPWQKTFDLKAQKGLRLMGWNANVFLDARNVLDLENQTGVFLTTGDIADESAFDLVVASHRQTLGGGVSVDRINLASLSDAGAGVRNEVDLIALRRAEARFGNGDGIFDAAEQDRAFRSAVALGNGSQWLIGSGRRVRLGFELTF
jgi:outer membrane receptor protein involved in Fe transport